MLFNFLIQFYMFCWL